MKALVLFSMISALALISLGARADDAAGAAEHYRLGRAHFDHERYDLAEAEFERAHALSSRPELLWNMAESARLAGASVRASALYNRYLREAPSNAPMRVEAQRWLAQLGGVTAEASSASSRSEPTLRAKPAPDRRTATKSKPLPRAEASDPRAEPSKPIHKKWWFWPGVGAVAAGIVAVAIVASRSDSGSSRSSQSQGAVVVDFR